MTWKPTNQTGIYRHAEVEGKLKVHATAKHPTENKIVHRRRTLNDATIPQAKKKFRQLKAKIRKMESTEDTTVDRRSITHFAAQWAMAQTTRGEWGHSTATSNRQNLRDHILPHIGHLRPAELSRDRIRDWIDYAETATYQHGDQERRYADDSVRRWWRILKQLVEALYLEGHCDRRFRDWCEAQAGPRTDIQGRREDRTLKEEEFREYIRATRQSVPERAPEIVTVAFTGMRPSELYGLRWQDVDLENSSLKILRGYTKGQLGSPKAGQRRIPMAAPVKSAFVTQRERLREESRPGIEQQIVFPSSCGTRRHPSTLYDPMLKVADAIGTDIRVGPQVLRKTLNTLLGNAGCRREMIKSIIGHQTNEMHAHYTEIRLEDQHDAMRRILDGTKESMSQDEEENENRMNLEECD